MTSEKLLELEGKIKSVTFIFLEFITPIEIFEMESNRILIQV